MGAPTAREALEHYRYLEGLSGEREMRERTKRIHEEYAMRGAVDFPDYVARGSTRTLPLADLIDMAFSIQAERHGHQTAVVLTARDKTPQTQVDRIERWLAIRCAQHLRRFHMLDEGGWHQLMSYAAVITWFPNGPRADSQSRIETPDPTTFCFPVAGAPVRPREFGREFEMQVSEASETYTSGGRSPYLKSDGIWGWYTAGADRPADSYTGSTGAKYGHTCRVIHVDDGHWTTYVGLSKIRGKGKPGGEVLWQDRNRAGPDEDGNPASQSIVIPGMIQPMRHPKDRLLPMFMPGIQAQHAINYLVALMASKVENAKPDILVEKTPEATLSNNQQGVLSAHPSTMETGNPNIVEVAGKPFLWNDLPIAYLSDLFGFWTARYDRWSNSLREISDPTMLAEINTNVYLPHSAARRKLMRPMIDFTNYGISEVLRMDVNALKHLGRKSVDVYAKGGEYHGKGRQELSVGEGASISWEDVKDFEKRFVLTIATNDMSDEEHRQLLLAHEEKVRMGYATKRQGISVAGYADEDAQVLLLAEDEVRMEATTLVKPQLATTIQQAIYYEAGILLELGTTAVGNTQPSAPPPGAGGGYEGAEVPGSEGLSEPLVAGAV
jgi:hypothetical protein